MSVNPFSAANAYASAARALNAGTGAAPAAKSEAGGFADMVKQALDGVEASGNAMNTQAAALGQGNSNVVDLVTAVAETEVAVETLVTVRDRVIAAYQDILNMPI